MDHNNLLACDIECYENYLLIMFKKVTSGEILYFEKFNDSTLNRTNILHILNKYTIVTFNGNKYDKTILEVAIAGLSNASIHKASKMLIDERKQPWEVRKQMGVAALELNHIDLIEVAPLGASLKIYGGRIHSPKMKDLPIDPYATILESDLLEMRYYCENDLDVTILLLKVLEKELDLRIVMSKEYSVDVRSKSDSQIAEAVIKHEMNETYGINPKRTKIEPGTRFKFKAPSNISFQTEQMQEILHLFKTEPFIVGKGGHMEIRTGKYQKDDEGNFILNKKGKQIEIPHPLANKTFKIGDTPYKIGMGGLHSAEKKTAHVAGKYLLKEIDVESYYPRIILNNKLAPKHLGKPFLTIYEHIVNRRLEAKRTGNKPVNESLKITINGTFGKLASKWSFLFSPDMMMQVTITGQLTLFMLIERLELAGVSVVSGNTDGIVVKMLPNQLSMVEEIVEDWEFETEYKMDYSDYSGLYSRDVNNYIAVKSNGEIKGKGAYADQSEHYYKLRKNPVNLICTEAVKLFLSKNKSIEDTIKECTDIRKFVTIRTVNGGALYEGGLVGKAVRWYYGKHELDAMYYKTSGNKVPRSDGAKPIMDLPNTLPSDIDYDWYIAETYKFLKEIGYTKLL